jgi:hypothetical protein
MSRQIRPSEIGQGLVVAIDHAEVEKARLLIDLLAGAGRAGTVLIGGAVDREGEARYKNRRVAGSAG